MQKYRALMLSSLLFIGSAIPSWAKQKQCNHYTAVGSLKKENENSFLVLFKDSRSVTKIQLFPGSNEKMESLLEGYADKKVWIEGIFQEKIKNGQGKMEIHSIKEAMPDFLDVSEGDKLKENCSNKV